jgi:transcription antitermination factor NusG
MKPGDRVRVTHGPLVGFAGIYSGMSGRQRIEVLLTLLGGADADYAGEG